MSIDALALVANKVGGAASPFALVPSQFLGHIFWYTEVFIVFVSCEGRVSAVTEKIGKRFFFTWGAAAPYDSGWDSVRPHASGHCFF